MTRLAAGILLAMTLVTRSRALPTSLTNIGTGSGSGSGQSSGDTPHCLPSINITVNVYFAFGDPFFGLIPDTPAVLVDPITHDTVAPETPHASVIVMPTCPVSFFPSDEARAYGFYISIYTPDQYGTIFRHGSDSLSFSMPTSIYGEASLFYTSRLYANMGGQIIPPPETTSTPSSTTATTILLETPTQSRTHMTPTKVAATPTTTNDKPIFIDNDIYWAPHSCAAYNLTRVESPPCADLFCLIYAAYIIPPRLCNPYYAENCVFFNEGILYMNNQDTTLCDLVPNHVCNNTSGHIRVLCSTNPLATTLYPPQTTAPFQNSIRDNVSDDSSTTTLLDTTGSTTPLSSTTTLPLSTSYPFTLSINTTTAATTLSTLTTTTLPETSTPTQLEDTASDITLTHYEFGFTPDKFIPSPYLINTNPAVLPVLSSIHTSILVTYSLDNPISATLHILNPNGCDIYATARDGSIRAIHQCFATNLGYPSYNDAASFLLTVTAATQPADTRNALHIVLSDASTGPVAPPQSISIPFHFPEPARRRRGIDTTAHMARRVSGTFNPCMPYPTQDCLHSDPTCSASYAGYFTQDGAAPCGIRDLNLFTSCESDDSCALMAGDIDGNGIINFQDLYRFTAILVGACPFVKIPFDTQNFYRSDNPYALLYTNTVPAFEFQMYSILWVQADVPQESPPVQDPFTHTGCSNIYTFAETHVYAMLCECDTSHPVAICPIVSFAPYNNIAYSFISYTLANLPLSTNIIWLHANGLKHSDYSFNIDPSMQDINPSLFPDRNFNTTPPPLELPPTTTTFVPWTSTTTFTETSTPPITTTTAFTEALTPITSTATDPTTTTAQGTPIVNTLTSTPSASTTGTTQTSTTPQFYPCDVLPYCVFMPNCSEVAINITALDQQITIHTFPPTTDPSQYPDTSLWLFGPLSDMDALQANDDTIFNGSESTLSTIIFNTTATLGIHRIRAGYYNQFNKNLPFYLGADTPITLTSTLPLDTPSCYWTEYTPPTTPAAETNPRSTPSVLQTAPEMTANGPQTTIFTQNTTTAPVAVETTSFGSTPAQKSCNDTIIINYAADTLESITNPAIVVHTDTYESIIVTPNCTYSFIALPMKTTLTIVTDAATTLSSPTHRIHNYAIISFAFTPAMFTTQQLFLVPSINNRTIQFVLYNTTITPPVFTISTTPFAVSDFVNARWTTTPCTSQLFSRLYPSYLIQAIDTTCPNQPKCPLYHSGTYMSAFNTWTLLCTVYNVVCTAPTYYLCFTDTRVSTPVTTTTTTTTTTALTIFGQAAILNEYQPNQYAEYILPLDTNWNIWTPLNGDAQQLPCCWLLTIPTTIIIHGTWPINYPTSLPIYNYANATSPPEFTHTGSPSRTTENVGQTLCPANTDEYRPPVPCTNTTTQTIQPYPNPDIDPLITNYPASCPDAPATPFTYPWPDNSSGIIYAIPRDTSLPYIPTFDAPQTSITPPALITPSTGITLASYASTASIAITTDPNCSIGLYISPTELRILHLCPDQQVNITLSNVPAGDHILNAEILSSTSSESSPSFHAEFRVLADSPSTPSPALRRRSLNPNLFNQAANNPCNEFPLTDAYSSATEKNDAAWDSRTFTGYIAIPRGGFCDTYDLAYLYNCLNNTPGYTCPLPYADIDHNNVLNMLDYIQFAEIIAGVAPSVRFPWQGNNIYVSYPQTNAAFEYYWLWWYLPNVTLPNVTGIPCSILQTAPVSVVQCRANVDATYQNGYIEQRILVGLSTSLNQYAGSSANVPVASAVFSRFSGQLSGIPTSLALGAPHVWQYPGPNSTQLAYPLGAAVSVLGFNNTPALIYPTITANGILPAQIATPNKCLPWPTDPGPARLDWAVAYTGYLVAQNPAYCGDADLAFLQQCINNPTISDRCDLDYSDIDGNGYLEQADYTRFVDIIAGKAPIVKAIVVDATPTPYLFTPYPQPTTSYAMYVIWWYPIGTPALSQSQPFTTTDTCDIRQDTPFIVIRCKCTHSAYSPLPGIYDGWTAPAPPIWAGDINPRNPVGRAVYTAYNGSVSGVVSTWQHPGPTQAEIATAPWVLVDNKRIYLTTYEAVVLFIGTTKYITGAYHQALELGIGINPGNPCLPWPTQLNTTTNYNISNSTIGYPATSAFTTANPNLWCNINDIYSINATIAPGACTSDPTYCTSVAYADINLDSFITSMDATLLTAVIQAGTASILKFNPANPAADLLWRSAVNTRTPAIITIVVWLYNAANTYADWTSSPITGELRDLKAFSAICETSAYINPNSPQSYQCPKPALGPGVSQIAYSLYTIHAPTNTFFQYGVLTQSSSITVTGGFIVYPTIIAPVPTTATPSTTTGSSSASSGTLTQSTTTTSPNVLSYPSEIPKDGTTASTASTPAPAPATTTTSSTGLTDHCMPFSSSSAARLTNYTTPDSYLGHATDTFNIPCNNGDLSAATNILQTVCATPSQHAACLAYNSRFDFNLDNTITAADITIFSTMLANGRAAILKFNTQNPFSSYIWRGPTAFALYVVAIVWISDSSNQYAQFSSSYFPIPSTNPIPNTRSYYTNCNPTTTLNLNIPQAYQCNLPTPLASTASLVAYAIFTSYIDENSIDNEDAIQFGPYNKTSAYVVIDSVTNAYATILYGPIPPPPPPPPVPSTTSTTTPPSATTPAAGSTSSATSATTTSSAAKTATGTTSSTKSQQTTARFTTQSGPSTATIAARVTLARHALPSSAISTTLIIIIAVVSAFSVVVFIAIIIYIRHKGTRSRTSPA